MKKCPCCKGAGYELLDTTEYNEDKVLHYKSKMKCDFCNGRKVVSDTLAAAYEEVDPREAGWCTCKDEHTHVYYKDGQHRSLYKHHWRCSACGLVTQVG